MMHFNQDLATLTQFFDDVLDGKLKGDAIQEKASTFFGYQGPWYTVGYEMAALVEKRFGRKIFTDCLLDRRRWFATTKLRWKLIRTVRPGFVPEFASVNHAEHASNYQ